MNVKSWQEILNEYTRVFENCRYDHITKDAETYIADIMSTDHQMDIDKLYRSFGTYRHDIQADTSIIKINETKISEKNILDNYYDIKLNDNFIFSGIVLNKDFATNGNELSLEDLFAEFGYDYLKACDASAIAHNRPAIYFEQPKIINNETIPGGKYEIVPMGNTYYELTDNNEYKLDDNGKRIETSIQYDGTYCPTVDEILSGDLYIVIKSGDTLKPQKIYFNNRFLPTLFINDDKHPQNMETYILEGQQTLKLCDICMFQKLGCQIIWDESLIILNNIKYYKKYIYDIIIDKLGQNSGVTMDDITFKFYFHVKLKLNSDINYYYVITRYGNKLEPATALSLQEPLNLNDIDIIRETDNVQTDYNVFLTTFNNNNATGKLTMGLQVQPRILLSMSMGVSLMLQGFSTIADEAETEYELYWFDYMENDNLQNIEFYIIFVNSISNIAITINDKTAEKEDNNFTISQEVLSQTYNITMDIPSVNDDLCFYFAIKYHNNFYNFIGNNENILYNIPNNNDIKYEINQDIINNIQVFNIQKKVTDVLTEPINSNLYDLKDFNVVIQEEGQEDIIRTIQSIKLTLHMYNP